MGMPGYRQTDKIILLPYTYKQDMLMYIRDAETVVIVAYNSIIQLFLYNLYNVNKPHHLKQALQLDTGLF